MFNEYKKLADTIEVYLADIDEVNSDVANNLRA
jgi:hypothetical protein